MARTSDFAQHLVFYTKRRWFGYEVALAVQLSTAADILLKANRHAAAESLLREALRIPAPSDDWRTCALQSMLGAALTGQARYAEAEAHLREGYDGMAERADANIRPLPQDLRAAAQRLVEFYTTTHRPDELAKWQAVANDSRQVE